MLKRGFFIRLSKCRPKLGEDQGSPETLCREASPKLFIFEKRFSVIKMTFLLLSVPKILQISLAYSLHRLLSIWLLCDYSKHYFLPIGLFM